MPWNKENSMSRALLKSWTCCMKEVKTKSVKKNGQWFFPSSMFWGRNFEILKSRVMFKLREPAKPFASNLPPPPLVVASVDAEEELERISEWSKVCFWDACSMALGNLPWSEVPVGSDEGRHSLSLPPPAIGTHPLHASRQPQIFLSVYQYQKLGAWNAHNMLWTS